MFNLIAAVSLNRRFSQASAKTWELKFYISLLYFYAFVPV